MELRGREALQLRNESSGNREPEATQAGEESGSLAAKLAIPVFVRRGAEHH